MFQPFFIDERLIINTSFKKFFIVTKKASRPKGREARGTTLIGLVSTKPTHYKVRGFYINLYTRFLLSVETPAYLLTRWGIQHAAQGGTSKGSFIPALTYPALC